MDFTRLTGSPDLDPVANVQPYSYRDARTHLEDIKALRNWCDSEFAHLYANLNTDSADWHKQVKALGDKIEAELFALDQKLVRMIEGSHDEMVSFDPTNGTRTEGISTVVSRMYDNLRIFGLFAKQFDAKKMTAKEWDDWMSNHSARHFDLAITYPNLNDVMG